MSPALIAHVIKLGYRVFMRNPSDSWLYYTDAEGKRIGQLSAEGFGGYRVLTVHQPNRITGTSFQMAERSSVDANDLMLGFAFAPAWAGQRELESIKKFRDWEHFVARDSWNAGYSEVLL